VKIRTILDQIDLGSVALPEFQRGYVWNREQVRSLMHSLLHIEEVRYSNQGLVNFLHSREAAQESSSGREPGERRPHRNSSPEGAAPSRLRAATVSVAPLEAADLSENKSLTPQPPLGRIPRMTSDF